MKKTIKKKTIKKRTTREVMVRAIIKLASDEYENEEDLIRLAKSSKLNLVEVLIGIAEYYREEASRNL